MNSENYYKLYNGFLSIQEIIALNPKGLLLDLGCGFSKPKGFIGIDNLAGKETQIEDNNNYPDLIMDLNNQKIPFPDESCLEIRSSHFLEHSNLTWIIDESYRLLKAGGRFNFIIPYANSAEGMYPGHQLFLTEKWFFENLNFQKKFIISSIKYYKSSYWKKSLAGYVIPFSFARKFLFNTCCQFRVHSLKISTNPKNYDSLCKKRKLFSIRQFIHRVKKAYRAFNEP
jgi:hypothetical protein